MTDGAKGFKAVLALTRAGLSMDAAHKIVSELPNGSKVLRETTNSGVAQATIYNTLTGSFTTLGGHTV